MWVDRAELTGYERRISVGYPQTVMTGRRDGCYDCYHRRGCYGRAVGLHCYERTGNALRLELSR